MLAESCVKVSVIVPVYNDGDFLIDTIKSVETQTLKAWEIIIIDDGSTDKRTLEILEKINTDKVKIFHIDNGGPSRARNYGIERARGEFILPLDADDLIMPTYLEKAVAVMDSAPNMGIVYCEAELFGKRTGKWILPEYSLATMLHNNVIFVTSLFRKSDWQVAGGFNENLKFGIEDYDFWLSIIELERDVYKIPEVLFKYRIKEVSRSTRFEDSDQKKRVTYGMVVRNHKKLYKDNLEIVLDEFRRNELEMARKIEKIKKLFPGYEFIKRHIGLKEKIKRLLFTESK